MWKDIYYIKKKSFFFSPDLFVSDLCNDADPDEVEILSLIQEQIPRYRLRADSISDFGGYSHQDWIQTPLINLDADLDLTDLQIAESLKYFSECFTVVCYLFAVCNLCNKFLHATAWAAQILYTLFNPFELIRSAHTVLCNFMSGWFSTVEPLINPNLECWCSAADFCVTFWFCLLTFVNVPVMRVNWKFRENYPRELSKHSVFTENTNYI